MKYSKYAVEIFKQAVKSNFLFFSEALNLFAWKYAKHFKFEEKHLIERAFSDEDKIRYFLSTMYFGEDGEIYVKHYEPNEIIPLNKEMKLALLKCIVLNGYMSNTDAFLSAIMNVSYMRSTKEVENLPPDDKLTDLLASSKD